IPSHPCETNSFFGPFWVRLTAGTAATNGARSSPECETIRAALKTQGSCRLKALGPWTAQVLPYIPMIRTKTKGPECRQPLAQRQSNHTSATLTAQGTERTGQHHPSPLPHTHTHTP
ncbi:unnamed protein product, partial [Ectocarpus fasciculatus]